MIWKLAMPTAATSPALPRKEAVRPWLAVFAPVVRVASRPKLEARLVTVAAICSALKAT